MLAVAAIAVPVPRDAWADAAPCVDGMAGGYPCSSVDLVDVLPLEEIGGGSGADLWGWTDPATGREYAIMGRSTGTAFVDVTGDPVYLGDLPSHGTDSIWRDVKVFDHYALVVAEVGNHGLQVFDLHELRAVTDPPAVFEETAHYDRFGRAHNVVVSEETGFAYAVGSHQGLVDCSGGLHMIDLADPLNPAFAGCYSVDGDTHDAQCLVYEGPDQRYLGREICFAANEDTLTVVDVTDKGAPERLSRTGYVGSGYVHQGWLTEDHAFFLLDDELDEIDFGHGTRTYVWDTSDLEAPVLVGAHTAATTAIDHNIYVRGGFAYQANYRAGLRILRLDALPAAELTEVAFFDVYPPDDDAEYDGAWSVYPWFSSGRIAVSSIEGGLFVLEPTFQIFSDGFEGGDLAAWSGGDP